jgi:hypothetical protein
MERGIRYAALMTYTCRFDFNAGLRTKKARRNQKSGARRRFKEADQPLVSRISSRAAPARPPAPKHRIEGAIERTDWAQFFVGLVTTVPEAGSRISDVALAVVKSNKSSIEPVVASKEPPPMR